MSMESIAVMYAPDITCNTATQGVLCRPTLPLNTGFTMRKPAVCC